MIMIKTSDAVGPALNWLVAKCEGHNIIMPCQPPWAFLINNAVSFCPSDFWEDGGPIIERERILLRPIDREGHAMHGQCLAMLNRGNTGTMVQWGKRADWKGHYWQGPTPLIAAMRCFVASKLGEEVEIPEELLHQN